MKFKAWTMPRFAAVVENWVGRPVQDRTGLNGEFDIEIEVGLDDLPLRRAERGAGAPPSGGPSLVGALESQLGLALESAQGLTDMLVIVSAEREPSPN